MAGKAADLAGMDVAATMAWIAYQLDQRNQEAVAKALSDATGRAIDLAGLAAGARAMQAALSLRGVA
ncbi:hypothetical protein ACQ858_19690 [Variovorax ureilyticus]|uniref:hypothetical protein n=1 Tax=Variovorax ureilyticus TaxID=1836198 RepID=UPI003D678599